MRPGKPARKMGAKMTKQFQITLTNDRLQVVVSLQANSFVAARKIRDEYLALFPHCTSCIEKV